jgi:hypothetical protein
VRGWLRRFDARLEAVRAFFTAVLVRVDVDPVVPDSAGSAWVDALVAITAAWTATASRLGGGGVGVGLLPVWRSACAVTSARLLSPSWPVPVINTN